MANIARLSSSLTTKVMGVKTFSFYYPFDSETSCQIYYVLNLVLTIKQHDRTIVFNESFPTLNSLTNEKTIKNEHGGFFYYMKNC